MLVSTEPFRLSEPQGPDQEVKRLHVLLIGE